MHLDVLAMLGAAVPSNTREHVYLVFRLKPCYILDSTLLPNQTVPQMARNIAFHTEKWSHFIIVIKLIKPIG